MKTKKEMIGRIFFWICVVVNVVWPVLWVTGVIGFNYTPSDPDDCLKGNEFAMIWSVSCMSQTDDDELCFHYSKVFFCGLRSDFFDDIAPVPDPSKIWAGKRKD